MIIYDLACLIHTYALTRCSTFFGEHILKELHHGAYLVSFLISMIHLTFVTGNQDKADYLARYLAYPVDHIALNLDEIQSTDLYEIAEHKVRQAYDLIHQAVIVEDVSLEFEALGGLPGPFIKFFLEKISCQTLCAMIPEGSTRKAKARCVFAYYDGDDLQLFESSLAGEIAEKPSGDHGYGWDKIFIPEGYTVTRASLDEEHNRQTYLQIKPFATLKRYLESK